MSAFVGLDLTNNLGYLTVPVVFLTSCLLPHVYAVAASGEVYDNANPRGWKDAMAKTDMAKPRRQRLLRAQNASENGFESIGIYAAGVVAANQAGLGAGAVNALTLGYLASRLGYVFSYVELGANSRLSGVRSGFWMVSMGLCFTLWVKAGLKAI